MWVQPCLHGLADALGAVKFALVPADMLTCGSLSARRKPCGRSTRVPMSWLATTTLASGQAGGTSPGQRRRAACQSLPIARTPGRCQGRLRGAERGAPTPLHAERVVQRRQLLQVGFDPVREGEEHLLSLRGRAPSGTSGLADLEP